MMPAERESQLCPPSAVHSRCVSTLQGHGAARHGKAAVVEDLLLQTMSVTSRRRDAAATTLVVSPWPKVKCGDDGVVMSPPCPACHDGGPMPHGQRQAGGATSLACGIKSPPSPFVRQPAASHNLRLGSQADAISHSLRLHCTNQQPLTAPLSSTPCLSLASQFSTTQLTSHQPAFGRDAGARSAVAAQPSGHRQGCCDADFQDSPVLRRCEALRATAVLAEARKGAWASPACLCGIVCLKVPCRACMLACPDALAGMALMASCMPLAHGTHGTRSAIEEGQKLKRRPRLSQ